MATRTITVFACDNCGEPQESLVMFKMSAGRVVRSIEVGEPCGCADKLRALMDKGVPSAVSMNGKKRGRPSNAERAERERLAS